MRRDSLCHAGHPAVRRQACSSANATGCSSIWGGSAAAAPYTVNKDGHGPAWKNSLFEDNAEFGLGMALAQNAVRGRLAELTEKLIASNADAA